MDAFILKNLEILPSLILLILVGASLYTLGKGADLLVDQAVKLSLSWGIPKVIVGATIVSLGTTVPESSVSVISALKGNPGLAIGNAIGSIIANTALILGVSSLIGRLPVSKKLIERQGKFLLLIAIILSIVSFPYKGEGLISQKIGFLFVALLIYYIRNTIKIGRIENKDEIEEYIEKESKLAQVIYLLIGVIIVVISSKVLIPSVELIATRAGIPQGIIASTLVAFGTSLPEFVTAITSVKKGHGELAVGNVVGANILNILLVIGLSASVTKSGLVMDKHFYMLQIPTMLLSLVTLYLIGKNKGEEISKKEGIFLLVIYISYLILSYLSM